MSKHPSHTSYISLEQSLDLDTPWAFQYIGIFASRLCLVLERFLDIEDYKVPASDPLEEAIIFFQKAKPELVRSVLRCMKSNGFIEDNITSQQFRDTAIKTLKMLLKNPTSVTKQAKQQLTEFYTLLEAYTNEHTPRFLNMNSMITVVH